ncbi:MAG: glycosyltransferase, partial [Candidatus Promineifilaceae bacterium]
MSVVVPAHNAAATLAECLAALAQQSFKGHLYEVIVVDDGSSDCTADIAANCKVRLLRQPHLGASAARNAGIAAATGELICFTDADCAPRPDWVEQLIAPLERPEVSGCKGIYATRQPERIARFVQLEYEDKYDRLSQSEYINFIDTYSAAYRRAVLVANNGFDEQVQFAEDQELSFRLTARGYKLVFQPAAVVHHRHVDSLAAYLRKKLMIGYWKAQVVRRFPERGLSDSHTPQVMKVQMGLAGLALAAGGLAWLGLGARLALAAALLLFMMTTVPFIAKASRKDPGLALLSPLILFGRATALGLGYVWGTLRPKPGITGRHSTISGGQYLAKRGLDVGCGLLGLGMMAVLAPFILLPLRFGMDGPLLSCEERVGAGGRRFRLLAWRTRPAGRFGSGLGRFLRRWRLDTLPRSWNVLRGDMSLVGPWPERPSVVAGYTDWHRRRLAVRPGLVGPGRTSKDLDERVRLELAYIEHYSLGRDLA